MDIDSPLTLLGGLTPAQFMRRHWQRKPLLVRNAVPGMQPLLDRPALFELAGQEGVESRVVSLGQHGWQLRRGPFTRRSLPAVARPRWTLLVQGVDLHVQASDGGGVGPHFDSYDVFLLQAQGRRRWRWGRQKDLSLREGLPLKILDRFEPEDDQVLEPGDMLYLPPRYAHDGIADGECQTYSIGFRH
jgi:50S ribosomal protein L16 3-hydroxylase